MQFGDKLPNGATVIHATEAAVDGVVLARTPFGPHPWVTWRYRVGDPASTYSGRYHYGLDDAAEDYFDRGGIW